MSEEGPDLADLAGAMHSSLDVMLAMLLLSKRIHVDNVAVTGMGRAKLDLSGEAIDEGLSLLAQTLAYQARRRQPGIAVQAEEGDSSSSLWQALKEFVLPPKQ